MFELHENSVHQNLKILKENGRVEFIFEKGFNEQVIFKKVPEFSKKIEIKKSKNTRRDFLGLALYFVMIRKTAQRQIPSRTRRRQRRGACTPSGKAARQRQGRQEPTRSHPLR